MLVSKVVKHRVVNLAKLFFIAIFLIFFSSKIVLADSFNCNVKNNCSISEICLFSVYQENNTHLAECGYFDYSFCCSNISSSVIKNSCTSSETVLVKLFQENNSHVSLPNETGYFKYLCIEPQLNCTLKAVCDSNESALFSMYSSDNSHIGSMGYFDNNVCCENPAAIIAVPSIGGGGMLIQYSVKCENSIYFGGSVPCTVSIYNPFPRDYVIKALYAQNNAPESYQEFLAKALQNTTYSVSVKMVMLPTAMFVAQNMTYGKLYFKFTDNYNSQVVNREVQLVSLTAYILERKVTLASIVSAIVVFIFLVFLIKRIRRRRVRERKEREKKVKIYT